MEQRFTKMFSKACAQRGMLPERSVKRAAHSARAKMLILICRSAKKSVESRPSDTQRCHVSQSSGLPGFSPGPAQSSSCRLRKEQPAE
jgi:hypothetical protein